MTHVFTKSDLYYSDYSDIAVPGDNPNKTKEDRERFSRYESYEVVDLINAIDFNGVHPIEITLKGQLIIEWMIHEKLPSDIQGRDEVIQWIKDNYMKMHAEFPRLHII